MENPKVAGPPLHATEQNGAGRTEVAASARSQDEQDGHKEDEDEEFFDGEDDDDECYMTMDDTPNQVQPGLFIGSFLSEQNRRKLQQAGITHVLQVAEGLMPSHPTDFKYLNIEVLDAPGEDLAAHFERAFRFIDDAQEQQGAVLVHCVAGVSRSSTVCIGWLMHKHKIGYEEAFKRVHKARPWVMPNPGFKKQLQRFEEQGCDPTKWRAWRHEHPEQAPAAAVVSLAGLPFSRAQQPTSGANRSNWELDALHTRSSTYMPELGTSL